MREGWLVGFLSLALGPSAVIGAAAQAQTLLSFDRIRVLEAPRIIDDAELVDHDGKAFRLSDLHDKVAFVLFGFTNCPDVCPVAMESLRQLHDSQLLAGRDVAYVMISVDGERDSPPAMRAFLAKFSRDFIGLTAEPSRVKPITRQFAATFFKGSHSGHNQDYNVTHSPQVFVLDPAGRLRAEVFGASVESMAGLATALLSER
jgi:protein SCO1/2